MSYSVLVHTSDTEAAEAMRVRRELLAAIAATRVEALTASLLADGGDDWGVKFTTHRARLTARGMAWALVHEDPEDHIRDYWPITASTPKEA